MSVYNPRCDRKSAQWAWTLGRALRACHGVNPFTPDSDHHWWWHTGKQGWPFDWPDDGTTRPGRIRR